MGFSFAGLQKELESDGFLTLYELLRTECRHLAPFADHRALIAFFHDRETDYETKDIILHHLVGAYRHCAKYEALAALFFVLFTPAIARLYARGRRICPELGDDDIIQEICLAFLQTIREADIAPCRMAGQIIGKVKNAIQALIRLRIKEGRHHELPGSREGPVHRFTDEEESSPVDEEGWIYGLAQGRGEAATVLFSADREVYDLSSVPDVSALLDDLERRKVITSADRQIIETTVIEGKPMKDIASTPADYQRLKKRRQRALTAMREYLLKNHQ